MRFLFTWITAPIQVRRVFEVIFRLTGRRNSRRPASLAEARRILIVRPDHLGDVILTSPFLREFRRNWPDAEITLLVSPQGRALVEFCPYVDHVEVYARFEPGKFGRIRRFWREVTWTARYLWPRHFDLAVVPRWDTQLFREAFLAYLSGAKWRVGFASEGNTIESNEEPYDVLYTHLVPSGTPKHEVEKSLDLLTWMGGKLSDTRTEIWLSDEDRKFAATLLKDPAGGERVVRVAMMPGSSSPSRRWPAECFGQIASWMTNEFGWEVVLVGSSGEAELGKVIEKYCSGVVNLIGRTSVRQTIAAIERCLLYVGNDTGPMHGASAAGVPVVEISCHPADGSPVHERSPVRFGARDVRTWIARPATGVGECRDYCVRGESGESHCVLAISLDQVKGLILEAAADRGLPTMRVG